MNNMSKMRNTSLEPYYLQFSVVPISVVVASLNEEEGIGLTIEELQRNLVNPQIIVVDGNSFDKTAKIAKKLGAEVLIQVGKGKGDAMAQGLKHLNPAAKYVVFTDADFTYPAKFLPKMIEILDQNKSVGMVIGNRFKGEINSQKSLTNAFYLGNRILAFAQHAVNGIKLEDPLSGLRVIRRELIEGWIPKSKGFDIEVEMNYLVERKELETIEIPIDYRDRLGEKKLKLKHGIGIFKRIISESFYA